MRINKDLRLRRAENKNFIVAVGELSKTFYGMVKLNDTAAVIFRMLQKNKCLEDIVKHLEKMYGISGEQAQKDVNETVLQFEKAGFLI